jgi:2'-5' RNA ligase
MPRPSFRATDLLRPSATSVAPIPISLDSATARKRRLFAGIALDDGVRAACAGVSQELQKTGYAAKFEAPEKLHVTLAFLGWVEPARVDDVKSALRAAASSAPFGITLDKIGAFPHERKPRVVFVGAREQGAPFRALAAAVRQRYAALGFDFDNDAVAHVTLARSKPPQRPLPLIEFVPIPLRVESLTLFESLPDPVHKTSRYEVLATIALGDLT